MLDAALAGRLGRPQLSRSGTITSMGTGGVTAGEPQGLASVSFSGGLEVGKTSAGFLGGAVVGLIVFYLWTRAQQA